MCNFQCSSCSSDRYISHVQILAFAHVQIVQIHLAMCAWAFTFLWCSDQEATSMKNGKERFGIQSLDIFKVSIQGFNDELGFEQMLIVRGQTCKLKMDGIRMRDHKKNKIFIARELYIEDLLSTSRPPPTQAILNNGLKSGRAPLIHWSCIIREYNLRSRPRVCFSGRRLSLTRVTKSIIHMRITCSSYSNIIRTILCNFLISHVQRRVYCASHPIRR